MRRRLARKSRPGMTKCKNEVVPVYRDEAVVLRTRDLGEADRIVSLLSKNHGRISAVVKGVRRTSSRFGARLEPFGHVDLQLFAGRSLDTVTQAVTVSSFGAQLVSNYPSWTAGTAMLEATERFTAVEKEPATQQFLLLVGGMRALVEQQHEPGLVLDAYLLRSLAISGWSPSFDACAQCGATGPHRSFHLASGGSVCQVCRPPGAMTPRPATLVLLGALLSGDWELAEASERRTRREGNALVAAFLQWHLERGLRSWPIVERA
jgi:DNA repair protein RecO (recombination protein O)